MSSAIIDRLAERILSLQDDIFVEETQRNVRFASSTDTNSFVAEQQNSNTKRMTDCHLRLFVEYLHSRDEVRQPEHIEPKMLDTYLASFLLNVRKAGNGSQVEDTNRQYEPCTLMAIHSSMHRYLSLKAYGYNIKEDECFRHSRDVLSAKMKQLKSMGKGNKPNASVPFTDNDVEICYEKQLLGNSKY